MNARLSATANEWMLDLAAGSAMVTTSPGCELNATNHTHMSVSVTDPRRRSLTQLFVIELQQHRKLSQAKPKNRIQQNKTVLPYTNTILI